MTSENSRRAPASSPAEDAAPLLTLQSPILKDVPVRLQARLGQAELSLQDLLALKASSVVKLDLQLNEPIELRLGDSLVARGEIVAVDNHFGVRILEVLAL
jgi:flagellar motor switch protein FliN/FliY